MSSNKFCLLKTDFEIKQLVDQFGESKVSKLMESYFPEQNVTFESFIKNPIVSKELFIVTKTQGYEDLDISNRPSLIDSDQFNTILKSIKDYNLKLNGTHYRAFKFYETPENPASFKWGFRKIPFNSRVALDSKSPNKEVNNFKKELKQQSIQPIRKKTEQELFQEEYLQRIAEEEARGVDFESRAYEQRTEKDSIIKPGVEELFDSNPQLANQVYEALGFEKSELIKTAEEKEEEVEQAFNDSESTFVYYGDEDMIDDESNRINPIDTVELSKEYRSKGLGTLKYILEGEKNLKKGMFMTSDPTKRVSQTADNIWKKLIKSGLAEIRNGRYYYIGAKITPQQKQQALQSYSQYLDQIFPTSQVKDIVYHGTDKIFDLFSKDIEKIANREMPNTANAYFFTDSLDRIKDYGSNKINVILNTKEVLNFKNINNDRARVLSDITYERARLYTDRNIDSIIADYDFYKDYIVFKPEQIHILGSKQDVKGFKSFVENKKQVTPRQGINEVFVENPQLAAIGTQEQYERYLDTIFPDSKVKDIVYRGAPEEDVKLFQYWTKNKGEAYMYAKANITKGGKITERNPISVIVKNFKSYINNKYGDNTFESLSVNEIDYFNQISETEYELQLPSWYKKNIQIESSDKSDFDAIGTLRSSYDSIKIEDEDDLDKPYTVNDYETIKRDYDNARKQLNKYFNIKELGQIKTAILKIENPYKEEIVQEDLQNDRDAYKNGHDGAFLMDGDHFLVKSNAKQIHILGSKQDVEGFKKFVDSSSLTMLQKAEQNFKSNITDLKSNLIFKNFSYNNKGNIVNTPLSDVKDFIKVNELNLKAINTSAGIELFINNQKLIPLEQQTQKLSKATSKVYNVLNGLSKRFNIQWEFDFNMTSKGRFDTKNNKVYINPMLMSEDTPFHEFLHPFILILKSSNPALYQKLIQQAKEDSQGLLRIKRLYPDLSSADQLDELLVQRLGEMAAQASNGANSSLYNKFVKWLNNLLNNILGLNKELSINSTLSDVAEYFVNSSVNIDLNQDFSDIANEDNLLQATDNEIETLYQLIEDASIKEETVNSWFKNVEIDIKNKLKTVESAIKRKEKDIDSIRGGKKIAALRNHLKETLDLVSANSQVASIAHYIDNTFSHVKERYTYYVNEIMPKLKNIESLSPEEVKDLTASIELFNQISKSNAVLNEIYQDNAIKTFDEFIYSPNSGSSIVKKLEDAIRIMDKLNKITIEDAKKVVTYGMIKPLLEESNLDVSKVKEEVGPRINKLSERIEYLRKQLAGASDSKQASINKKIEELAKKRSYLMEIEAFQAFTPEAILESLSFAQKDVSLLSGTFLPLASYADPVPALFAKFFKKALYRRLEKTRETEFRIGEIYKKFRNKNGSFLTSQEEFKDLIEFAEEPEFGYDSQGNISVTGYRKVKKLVGEFDSAAFYAIQKEMYLKAESLFGKERSNKKSEYIAKWFEENTEPKPLAEIKKIIKHHRKLVEDEIWTQEEYDAWEYSNVRRGLDGQYKYMKDLSVPRIDKYTSKKWKQLQLPQNKHKLEFLKSITELYLEAQNKYPDAHRMGLKLPSVDKGFQARIVENGAIKGIKETIQDFTKYMAKDQQYGFANIDGTPKMEIPVYFTQNMEADDVSSDIVTSILLFADQANLYESKEEIAPEVKLFLEVMKQRTYGKNDSMGNNIMDKSSELFGLNRQLKKSTDETAKTTKETIAFIEKNFFGIGNKKVEIMGIAADKVMDNLMAWQATATLGGFRPLKQIANNVQANLMNLIEAQVGKYIDKPSFAWGKGYYALKSKSIISDILDKKLTGKSLETQLIEYFDVIKGNYIDELGKTATGNIAKKMSKNGMMFFSQNMSEHEAQVSAFFGYLKFNKVKKDGVEIPLIEAFELDKDGKMSIKKGVDLSQSEIDNFRLRISALSDRLYGVYNSVDKTDADRNAIWRSVLMFRRFMPPGFERRYKKLSFDYQLNDFTEGFYISFKSMWLDIIRDAIREREFSYKKHYASMTPLQKENVARAYTELALIALFATAAMVLSQYADDDEFKESDNILYKKTIYGLEYEFVRLASELNTYGFISPVTGLRDLSRIISTPSVMSSFAERLIKFVGMAVNPFSWNDEYKRDYGIWKKGDSKLLAKFFALFGITGNEWNPELGTKNIKRFL